MHYRTTSAVVLFILASALYVWGICPTISWRDAPEFVTIAHTLGVGHPTGSPTYSLLAKLSTFVPIGNIAWRVNAFSALAAACTVILLFLIVSELYEASSSGACWSAATSSALFLMVSESLWSQAEIAEVYTLQNCVLLVLLTLLLKARHAPSALQHRYYWLFAFFYGLSAGVHATMALFAPALLLFIGLTKPRTFHPKELAFLTFFFLCGFAVYLYVPLRSLSEPAFDWGNPESWRQFLHHITDHKDSGTYTVVYWHKVPYQIWRYLHYLINEFTIFGCLIGLIGFIYLFRTDKPLWLSTVLIFLGHTAFLIRTWVSPWGFIPSYVIFALWIGCGVHAFTRILTTIYDTYQIRLPRLVLVCIFSGGLVLSLGISFQRHRFTAPKSHDYSSSLYGNHLLTQLPPDAILFCDYAWFPLLYLQHIEQRRPDLTFILQGNIFFPQYFAPFSRHRFPNIQLVTSTTAVRMTTLDYFWHLVTLNADTHQIFWEPNADYQSTLSSHLIPVGLLFRLAAETQAEVITPQILSTHWAQLEQALPRLLQQPVDQEAMTLLADKLSILGRYLHQMGFYDDATRAYVMALGIRPHAAGVHNNYGTLLLSQHRFGEARDHFITAYAQDPIHPTYNKNLGTLLVRIGLDAQAIPFLKRAVMFGATGGDVYAQLGVAYARQGQFPEALRALQTALTHYGVERTPQALSQEKLAHNISLVRSHINRIKVEMQRATAQ